MNATLTPAGARALRTHPMGLAGRLAAAAAGGHWDLVRKYLRRSSRYARVSIRPARLDGTVELSVGYGSWSLAVVAIPAGWDGMAERAALAALATANAPVTP